MPSRPRRYRARVNTQTAALHDDAIDAVISWFEVHRRDLPWRGPVSDWAVLVSEIMLQQTPVARVLAPWAAWMRRWPTPADLAAADTAEVLRAWGTLGYPRRALRLQECARVVVARHDGSLPRSLAQLQALPGIGEYTAAAVTAFAHDEHAVVVDTNVRRVLARAILGQQFPAPSYTAAERRLATATVPADRGRSVAWNQAVMEFGALVCTARVARCEQCPLAVGWCRWQAAGRPEHEGPARRVQPFEGTDRQMRGRIMALLRAHDEVPRSRIDALDPERPDRVRRCLTSLLEDGLAVQSDDGIRLPR